MKIRLNSILLALAIVCVGVLATGCGGDASTNAFTPLPSDGGGDDDDEVTGDLTGFYVEVKADRTIGLETSIHKFNSFSSTCSVPVNSTTAQDINCLVNVKELDLYFSGITLQVNYPSTMCPYLAEVPYWYYMARGGIGPADIEAVVNETTDVVESCEADGVAGVVNADGTCTVAEGTFAADGAFTCAYDHTLDEDLTRNCCSGDYQYTYTPRVAGVLGTPVVTDNSHGGNPGNCARSPVELMNGYERSDITGYFKTLITNSTDVQKNVALPAVINVDGVSTNILTANFYGWDSYKTGNFGAAPASEALTNFLDISGSTITAPNVPYTFNCLNHAGKIKHRINVYVNEWDTDEQFEGYHVSGATTYSPDVLSTDVEGVNCETDAIPGAACDDVWDWEQVFDYGVDYPEE